MVCHLSPLRSHDDQSCVLVWLRPLPNHRPAPGIAGGVSPHRARPNQSRRSSDDYATPPPPVPAPSSPLLYRKGGAWGHSRKVPTPGRTALTAPSSPATRRSVGVATAGLGPQGQPGAAEDAQALQLLAEVVDKLQGLMASRTHQALPPSRIRPPKLDYSSPSSCSSCSSSSSLTSGEAPQSTVQVNGGGCAGPFRPGADCQVRLNNGAVRGASADSEHSGCLAARRRSRK